MPEDATPTTQETQAAPGRYEPPPEAGEAPPGLNVGLLVLFVVIVVLVVVQNVWLRRRARREGDSDAGTP